MFLAPLNMVHFHFTQSSRTMNYEMDFKLSRYGFHIIFKGPQIVMVKALGMVYV